MWRRTSAQNLPLSASPGGSSAKHGAASRSIFAFNQKLYDWLAMFATTHRCSKSRQLKVPPIAASLGKDVCSKSAVSTLRTKLNKMRSGLIDLGVPALPLDASLCHSLPHPCTGACTINRPLITMHD